MNNATKINIRGKTYYVKNWNERMWLMLLHHNFEAAGGFVSESEALSSKNPNRYSILSELNSALKINGKFEFHLEYPTYKIHWSQNDNPVSLDESKYTSAPGLYIFPSSSVGQPFGGLARSTMERGDMINCLLDGTLGSSVWYYGVGMYNKTEGGWYKIGIPGANSAEKMLTLWLRISLGFGFYKTYNVIKITRYLYLLILIISVS